KPAPYTDAIDEGHVIGGNASGKPEYYKRQYQPSKNFVRPDLPSKYSHPKWIENPWNAHHAAPAAIDDPPFAAELPSKITGGRFQSNGAWLEDRSISLNNDLQRDNQIVDRVRGQRLIQIAANGKDRSIAPHSAAYQAFHRANMPLIPPIHVFL